MKIQSALAWGCIGLMGVFSLTGCPPKKKLALAPPKVEKPPQKEQAAATNKPGIEINQDWTEIPQLTDVRFEFDKANLTDAARDELKLNVAFIKKLPNSVKVRVEGNCDKRGTVEYNIALGQRRANVVRSYYKAAGISGSRIETISFGDERPLCSEATDACWAQNRRSATKLRNNQPIALNPENLEPVGNHPMMAHAHDGTKSGSSVAR